MKFEESKQAIAQIHPADSDTIVGTGFLVEDRYLLTCAHVVNSALLPDQEPIGASLSVTFFNNEASYPAIVIYHKFDEMTYGADAAVLYLSPETKPSVKGWQLHPLHLQQLNGAEIYAFGYPGGRLPGLKLTAVTHGEVDGGWIQIQGPQPTSVAVEEGFSGAPVWSATEQAWVGMIVARDQERTDSKIGFIIPTQKLIAPLKAIQYDLFFEILEPHQQQLSTQIKRAYQGCQPEHWPHTPQTNFQDIRKELISTLSKEVNEFKLVKFTVELLNKHAKTPIYLPKDHEKQRNKFVKNIAYPFFIAVVSTLLILFIRDFLIEINYDKNFKIRENSKTVLKDFRLSYEEKQHEKQKETLKEAIRIGMNLKKEKCIIFCNNENNYSTTEPIYMLHQILELIDKETDKEYVRNREEFKISNYPLWKIAFIGNFFATGGWDQNMYFSTLGQPDFVKVTLQGVITDIKVNKNTIVVATKEGKIYIFEIPDEFSYIFKIPDKFKDVTKFREINIEKSGLLSLDINLFNDEIVTGNWKGVLKFWELNGDESFQKDISPNEGPIGELKFSSSGKFLASVDESGNLVLIDIKDKEENKIFYQSLEKLSSVDFSADEKSIITAGDDGIIRVRNLSKNRTREWDSQQRRLTAVRFNYKVGKQQLIASSSWDHKVKLWNQVGQKLAEWNVGSPVTSISFSPDGKKIIASTLSGKVFVLNVYDLDALINEACEYLMTLDPETNICQ